MDAINLCVLAFIIVITLHISNAIQSLENILKALLKTSESQSQLIHSIHDLVENQAVLLKEANKHLAEIASLLAEEESSNNGEAGWEEAATEGRGGLTEGLKKRTGVQIEGGDRPSAMMKKPAGGQAEEKAA